MARDSIGASELELESRAPRRWVESHFNVQQWTEMPRGGHFAAMEAPDLLIDDVRSFFRGQTRTR